MSNGGCGTLTRPFMLVIMRCETHMYNLKVSSLRSRMAVILI